MSFVKNLLSAPLLYLIVLLTYTNITTAQPLLEILPMGNSLTRGSMCFSGDIFDCATNRMQDADAISYRYRLLNLMTNDGYNIDYVGNQNFGYSVFSDSQTAGFSGIRDDKLADVVATGTSSYTGQVTPGPYLNYYPADIILLHIGTNDVFAGDHNSVYDVERILDAVDAYETANNKSIVVFLARIISRRDNPCNTDFQVRTYNNKLVNMAQTRINSGDKIVIVDMECGAGINYYNDMADQAHLNQNGYDKMADKWFEAINSYNTAPVVSQIPNQSVDRGISFSQISLDSYVTDVEDASQDMTWSIYPANPENFNISIDANRIATITPKNAEWSGSESIEFVAMDMGKDVPGLQKTDNSIVQFTINWVPEITGQQSVTIPENEPYEITLDDLIIVDPDHAPGGIQIIVDPGANYSVLGSTITPSQNYVGNLSVPLKISVGGNESNTFNVSIEVNQVNFPPVISSTPVQTVKTNEQYIYQMVASDPDPGDVLTYSATIKPGWLQVEASTGLVYGTPSAYDTGIRDVTLVVSDGDYQVEQSFTIEVVYFNHPPVIVSDPEDTALVSQIYSYGIQATDAEGDPVHYFASSIPDWMDFNSQSRVLIGAPKQENIGTHLVVLGATDQNDTTYQAYNLYVKSVVSSIERESGKHFRVYPNPASSYILLDLGNLVMNQDLVFELHDLTGKKIMHTRLTDPLTEIRLESLGVNNGIYLYRLMKATSAEILQTGKIMLKFTAE